MCSLRSQGPPNFIPNTVENQKSFSLYFHKIARTAHSAALVVIDTELYLYDIIFNNQAFT